ncbi:MAG: bifunctional diaminohydroxyphosphoribosylaminopyrimidine deaminase/5-amino-6-(5-phosphoribosylamino)uracil reductase RibD [Spirochaetales bacterium]|nr:bifunctional diaminohydroxyphosphoribosylaminopyrimidine deaminase/5-amino-6-(5-phosphoribosylamino)uracil reductase RibD [Spirochaetales bacterium]
MKKVISLAQKARGMTSPNPLVGAIIMKNNSICGQGYHHKAGTPHAEIMALRQAKSMAKGSTLYVNLEPCCHCGKTPPCTKAIIEHKIKRVVIGMKDPNPLVAGKGIEELEKAGISVTVGVMEESAKKLNEIFCKYITTGMPYITMKTAVTLDGKIATYKGISKWITGESARQYVHKQRFIHDAVMVGIGTILKDDPLLTCRLPGKKNKLMTRIIVDSKGTIPLTARVLMESPWHRTIVAVTKEITSNKSLSLKTGNTEVVVTKSKNGKVDVFDLFHLLGKKGITSILLEGGGTLNAAVIEDNLADKLLMFIAPKIIGGTHAPTFIEGIGKSTMDEALNLSFSQQKWFDNDLMLEYYFKPAQ